LFAGLLGCGGRPAVAPGSSADGTEVSGEAAGTSGYPTHLVSPSSVPGDWVLEQEVAVTHQEGQNRFQGVVQKRGDELLLLVLGPASRPALTIRQRGDAVEVTRHVPVTLPFPARFMIHDVHRAWMRPAGTPPPGGRGTARREAHGEEIVETWSAGRVEARSYRRLDAAPAGRIEVRYGEPGLAPGPLAAPVPDPVVIDNGWFGYELRITTNRYTPISRR